EHRQVIDDNFKEVDTRLKSAEASATAPIGEERIVDESITFQKVEGVTVSGKNIYGPSQFVKGYIDGTGAIISSPTYGRARIPVTPNTKYSLYRPGEDSYKTSGGWTLFTNTSGELISKVDGSLYISGTYNNRKYITITTPDNC
ncbi:hypothetical protein COL13_27445, partial [Bacillus cereus]